MRWRRTFNLFSILHNRRNPISRRFLFNNKHLLHETKRVPFPGIALALWRPETTQTHPRRRNRAMTQNTVTIRRTESLRQLPRVAESIREETERTLGDIAYVLHLT